MTGVQLLLHFMVCYPGVLRNVNWFAQFNKTELCGQVIVVYMNTATIKRNQTHTQLNMTIVLYSLSWISLMLCIFTFVLGLLIINYCLNLFRNLVV
jgi:hypothetical protein